MNLKQIIKEENQKVKTTLLKESIENKEYNHIYGPEDEKLVFELRDILEKALNLSNTLLNSTGYDEIRTLKQHIYLANHELINFLS